MLLETVCTGDELLTGLTADTNSLFFQDLALRALGVRVARSTVVGDRVPDIASALREAAGRADAVLVSGGLGPTLDDLTAEAAAQAAGVPLDESAAVRAHLEARYRARGVALTPNNLRQARVPRGAEVVLNPHGAAPLFVLPLGKARLFFVPGVPKEYRHLVEHEVLPRLQALLGPAREHRQLRLLKTVLLPESHLDAKVQGLVAQHPDVEFGTRTHAPENHLKLLARGATAEACRDALARAEAACRAALGAWVFGADDETLPQVVGALLLGRRQTVAVAESCTGGLVAEQLTRVAGASAWVVGGAVTYQARVKQRWARVEPGLLAAHGEVSREVAEAMAEGVRAELGADWGVGVTGWAGPGGGTGADPAGTVYVAVAGPGGAAAARHAFPGDRERVRGFAAAAALDALRRRLLESRGGNDG